MCLPGQARRGLGLRKQRRPLTPQNVSLAFLLLCDIIVAGITVSGLFCSHPSSLDSRSRNFD
jgi:hypothetical protein